MNEDKDFVRAILADRDNDTLRLVYADWLEERGDARAEFLRLAVRLRNLDEQDPDWKAHRLRLNDLRAAMAPRWLNLVQRPANADEEFYFPNRPMRLRPGMYVPGLNVTGLHYLANELISYSMEEIQVGHGTTIEVRVHADGSLTIRDDGRGISLQVDPESKGIALEMIMTGQAFVGGHHGQQRLTGSSRGLHYMGAATVVALADWATVAISSDGCHYRQEYERGLPITDIDNIGPSTTPWGTTITFHPDPEIFTDVTFAREQLATRIRELAFLNSNVITKLVDERAGVEEQFHYPDGVADFVAHLRGSQEGLHGVIHSSQKIDGIRVEVAMQYTASYHEKALCYTNNALNRMGTHRRGFRAGLTRALNAYLKDRKHSLKLGGSDSRVGLIAVVSVHLPEPIFESQNKAHLGNPEVEGLVSRITRAALSSFLQQNPDDARRIIAKLETTATGS